MKFAIDFVDKYRGISKTTDLLIDAQIKQIVDYREFIKKNDAELKILINEALKQQGCNLSEKDLKKLILKLLYLEIEAGSEKEITDMIKKLNLDKNQTWNDGERTLIKEKYKLNWFNMRF